MGRVAAQSMTALGLAAVLNALSLLVDWPTVVWGIASFLVTSAVLMVRVLQMPKGS